MSPDSVNGKWVDIKALTLSQPLGQFYVAVIPAKDLIEISYADVRRIKDRSVETYTGIQRPLSPSRVREIEQYIGMVDATFPNSIIVTVPNDRVEETGTGLRILKARDTVKIIDGQHRLAGFNEDNATGFELIVSIFVDLELEDQAAIFSTINLKQTKVSPSLVYELFELEVTRSPQKTAHDMVKALNRDEDSPLFKRIKILGVVPKVNGEALYRPLLTQGTFVKRLLPLISENPESDRDLAKRGKQIELIGDEVERGYIFRPFYATEKDWAILKTLKNFFTAVSKAFSSEWESEESPLARSIGYGALMRLLQDLYRRGYENKDVSFEYFFEALKSAKRNADEGGIAFTFENFPASGKGETDLYRTLARLCGLDV